MSSQVAVNSIEALKDLRVALALYGEDALGALGTIGAEVRRTVYWLQHDRPAYWHEQIKRRRERVSGAKAELFRKQLAQTPGSSTSLAEQVENVRRAVASLEDAEKRLILTRKWQSQLNQAILEYHGTIRRIKSLASGEVPSAVNLLTRLIDSLEAYIRVAPVSRSQADSASTTVPAEFETIATKILDAEPPAQDAPEDESADDLLNGGDPSETEPPA
ncbi:MAG: hypothetical protein JWN86_4284 [Planctomycetota bacterium]|nr:hypothetical protein [Planctomycetota bacterium]